MSRQRSSQSTSGRSSQSGTARTSATSAASTASTSGASTAEAGGMVEQAKEKTQELAGQVQQKATERVESGLARGKTRAAETLNTVAQSLVTTGQNLREQNQEPISRYVEQAADRVQRVSNYLQNTDVSEIVDRTEEFARRRPAVFLGGAFALGLLGARFLKSSRRQQTGSTGFGGNAMRSGQAYSRERSLVADQEVSTPRAQNEWAASGGSSDVSGFADVAEEPRRTPPNPSDFNRQRGQIDYGLPPGGPEAPQH